MPSSAAASSALASGLVALHRSGFFDLELVAKRRSPTQLCGAVEVRDSRMYADMVLSPLRERAISLLLSPRSELEIVVGVATVLSVLGIFPLLHSCYRCCRRRPRVQPIRRVLKNGADGASRSIARRGIVSVAW